MYTYTVLPNRQLMPRRDGAVTAKFGREASEPVTLTKEMRMESNAFSSAAVIGSGYMGGGIAQVLALGGYRVVLGDVDAATAERSRERLVAQGERFEAEGLFPGGAGDLIRANLAAADSIEEATAQAAFITEAVPEDLGIKHSVLSRISGALGPDAIVGSNTSAIPISRLSTALSAPDRFLGVHWMNPAPFIPGVELIPGPATSAATFSTVEALVRGLGKVTARVADTPGFVANRLQFALYKEASRIVEEGTASATDIDAVVSNTFGFRLALFGPFAIGDMAGLDVYNASYATLEDAFGERFASPLPVRSAVETGNLGTKSGGGLLGIDPNDVPALLAYRDAAYARLSQLRSALGRPPGL